MSGCAVFRVSGPDTATFHCSTGRALLLPIRVGSRAKVGGLHLEPGTITSIDRAVSIEPSVEFLALFPGRKI